MDNNFEKKKLYPTSMPGFFTGNYVGELKSSLLTNGSLPLSFAGELEKASSEFKSLKPLYSSVMVKLPNNGLPATSSLVNEVGFYGLRYGRLDLCQYYKKTSPPPNYFF